MIVPDFSNTGIAAFFSIFGATIALGCVWGGKPEKYGIFILVAMLIAEIALYSVLAEPVFDNTDLVGVVTDVIGLAGFTAIALNANRLWPLFASAMQLISLLAHLTHGFRQMLGQSYADFAAFPTAIALVSILIGVCTHRYRIHKYSQDRDWVSFRQYAEFRRLSEDSEQF